jgi:Ca2+-transporting ATPase
MLVAMLMAAGAIGLFLWEYRSELAQVGPEEALAEARTMAVTTVVFFQAFYLLDCRSMNEPVFRLGLFTNRAVLAGIGLLLVLQAGFVYVPFMQVVFDTRALGPDAVALSALVGAVVLPVVTIEKALRARAEARRGPRRTPHPGSRALRTAQ